MGHEAYIRYLPGSETAVLMVHGIVGSPIHFDCLLPLVPEDWSVYNILLDGHGGTTADFGRTSMKKWKAQVAGMLALLRQRHEKIVVVGHSMGTLLTLREVVADPEKIAHMFLLAVPLRPWVSWDATVSSVKLALGTAGEKDRTARQMRADSSVALSRNIFAYIPWIPRFAELLWEAARTRQEIGALKVPCMAVQSARDQLVSMRSTQVLEGNSNIRLTVLADSGHFCYEGRDLEQLRALFRGMVEMLETCK